MLRTFALIVCAQRYCAGNATVICHALLSEVQVLKPLQKPWTISLAQRWIREDRDQSKLIKNIYESQVDYCTTDIREVLSVVH